MTTDILYPDEVRKAAGQSTLNIYKKALSETEKPHTLEIIPSENGSYVICCPVENQYLQLFKEPNYCPMCGIRVDFSDPA